MYLMLNDCDAGESVEVVELDPVSGLSTRLQELGLIPGATLRVVRPGCPMVLALGESRFCLRAEEAESIVVRAEFGLAQTVPARESAGY